MPMKRGNVYYVKRRRLPGVGGPIYKSLGTRSKAQARRLESAIVRLAEKGHAELVRAWLDDVLDAHALAEAAESGRLHELARELERASVPLREAVDAALKAKEADVKDRTVTRYREGLTHFMRIIGKETPVHEALQTEAVREFKRQRREEKVGEKPVGRETINKDLIAVSILCTYALEQGWIDRRPKIKKYATRIRIRYLEADQLRVYMAALRAPFRPLFQLLVGTGMRLGEAEALRVCDLRLAEGESRALVEDAKSPAGTRAVFIPPWVTETLRTHLEETGGSGTDPVFTIPRGTIEKEHQRARKIAGISEYTIHDHRHTAAVHLARAGMPLHLLQQQLGHATIAMTMRYARFHPDYGDVGAYFDRVQDGLGLGAGAGRVGAGCKTGSTREPAEREAAE